MDPGFRRDDAVTRANATSDTHPTAAANHRRAVAADLPTRPPSRVSLVPAWIGRGIEPAARTHDQQHATKFEYLRCARGHGRLITFVNFLLEKDFIRPLSPEQIDELRQRKIQVISCSKCGAPVDLTRGPACAHCGASLSMLDVSRMAGADWDA